MAILHLLGTGAAVSDPHRTTTMLAVECERSVVVVDCGGDVVQRLMEARIDLDKIEALIVTHEHPDHVGGFPLFIEKLWVAGRRRGIRVLGNHAALDHARRLIGCFDLSGWDGLPEIAWQEVELREGAVVLDDADWRITASPGDHAGVPVIGLRIEARPGGGTVAYSCDTAPCDAFTRLARNADLLIHEATGDFPGHSTAAQAAAIAAEAQAARLVLVHLPPARLLDAAVLDEARQVFAPIEKGEELGRYPF